MRYAIFVITAFLVLPVASAASATIASMDGVDDLNYSKGAPEVVPAGPNGGDVSKFNGSFAATLNPDVDLREYDLLKIQMKAERSAFAHLTVDNVPWEDKRGNWYFLDGLQPGFDWKTIWIDLDRPESGLRSSTGEEETTIKLNGQIKDTGRSTQNAENIWIGDIRAVKEVVEVDWNQSEASYSWSDDLVYTYPLRVSNVHDEPVNATLSLNGYEAPHASATLSEDQVELQPGESTTVTATLTLPSDVADSAEQLYTERFRVTAEAEGYADSKVTVLRSADPIPLTVTVPPSEDKLDFPILPTPSEVPDKVLRFSESMAREEASRDADQVIANAKENGIYNYNESRDDATYRKTLIAASYLYDLTGEKKFLEKSRTLLRALPEIWEEFYAPYESKQKRLISSGIVARWNERAHFTLGLGWRLMGAQRPPYQYGTAGNNARGSMSSIFYAFDMIAQELDQDEREEIIDEFIVPAGIQSRNHLIGDGNQQSTANAVALYAGLSGGNWPLTTFATSGDHGVHEIMDWTFADNGSHIRGGYQTYTLQSMMWNAELLYALDTNFYNLHRDRLEDAYSLGGNQYFWEFVTQDRVSQGGTVSNPSELTATPVGGKIRLEWEDSMNEARYVVERSTSPDSGYEQIGTTRRNTAVHTDYCTTGTTYYYRVKAYNYNDEESSYSDTATATCGEATSCSPSAEICDGEDNDCDGLVDEGCTVDNQDPTVSFSSLSDDESFDAPASLGVEATAADSDGSVSNVTLAVNGETVRAEGVAPYQWGDAHPSRGDGVLENMSPGAYELSLKAVDDDGGSTMASVTVTIREPQAVNLSAYPEPHDDVTFAASSVSVVDDLVFDTGYVYVDGAWESFSLSGNRVSDAWLVGSATGGADFASAEYAAVYSCSTSGGFDCHGGWQVANLTPG